MNGDAVGRRPPPPAAAPTGVPSSSPASRALIFLEDTFGALSREEHEAAAESPTTSAPPTTAHPRCTPNLPAPQTLLTSSLYTHPQFASLAGRLELEPGTSGGLDEQKRLDRYAAPDPPRGENKQAEERVPPGTILVRVLRNGRPETECLDLEQVTRLYAARMAALRAVRGRHDFVGVPRWLELYPRLGTYLAEGLGTFACALSLALAASANRSLFNATNDPTVLFLPVGFTWAGVAAALGYVSGAYLNPAFTFAGMVLGVLPTGQTLGYVLVQLTASFAAGVVGVFLEKSGKIYVPRVASVALTRVFWIELTYVFLLTMVFSLARAQGAPSGDVAIGFVVLAGLAAIGVLTGGVMNPAISMGLQTAQCLTNSCESLENAWIEWVTPMMGSGLAAFLLSHMWRPGLNERMYSEESD